jgi:hypothetical protein
MCNSLRRLAEPRRDQHRRHLRPRDALLPRRQQPLAQLLQTEPAPQCQRQINIPKSTRAFDADALQAYRHRQIRGAVIEQPRLLRGSDQPVRQCPRFDPPMLVKLAEMRHRLLNHTPADAHAAHQAPITVDLAVLLANHVAQVHAPSEPRPRPKKIPKVVTTRSNRLRMHANTLIGLNRSRQK